jgi:HAD superfamily hydrolase (TIGR01509 family)
MAEAPLKIKAVYFDLGETLLTFGRVNTSILFRQSAKVTCNFLQSIGQPTGSFKIYSIKNLLALRICYWFSNIIKKDFDALSLLKKVNKKINLSESQWQELAWLWYEPLSKMAKVEPDIIETLQSLKKLDLKLGILSNTFIHSNSLDRHLQQLNILDFFSVRVYSSQFKFRKPDVRIFKAAAERIGQAPENILFVGDLLSNDIKPALKAGMKAVLKITEINHNANIPQNAYRINRLSELPHLIKQMNSPQNSKIKSQ